MPRVRYTDDAGRYRVAGETFEPGDEAEVTEGLAEHLVDDVERFERVDSDGETGETLAANPPEDADVEPAVTDEAEAEDNAETCQTIKSDGEVCGRDLPCPYHSDDEEA